MNFNKTILVGRLVKDIELRYIGQNETAVVNNGLATNRVYSKDGEKKEETTFVDFQVFGRAAEVLSEYSGKGSEVLLEGRLVNDTWETEEGKRSKLVLHVENVQLGSKQEAGDKPKKAKSKPKAESKSKAESKDDDSDVPF